MTAPVLPLVRPWPTEAGCQATGGHDPRVLTHGTICCVCEASLPHHVTVTVGPVGEAVGRAWFDCTCGLSATYPSKRAANTAAIAHFGEVYGTAARDALIERAVQAGAR